MPDVQHKRGTRADLDTLAAADGLLVGQIYVITDEDRLAVALSIGSYQAMAKRGEGAVDATNVAAAGALMDSEVTNLAQVKAFSSSDYAAASHTHTIANVTSLQTSLNAKAPLASPALTGNPTAPTQTAGNNTTRIATTAFVATGLGTTARMGTSLTGGFASDIHAVGTQSSGTFTPTISATVENIKTLTNGGAHTWAIPSANGSIVVQVTNNGSAGAITFAAGYQKVDGDDLTTTNGEDFMIHLFRVGSFATATVVALQ